MRAGVFVITVLLLLHAAGCAHRPPSTKAPRVFRHETDTFSFANQTVWKYEDGSPVRRTTADWSSGERYSHHCFVMSRAALEFWKFARFDPALPQPTELALSKLIDEVVQHRVVRPPLPLEDRVVIPGFTGLRELSEKHQKLLQERIGKSWITYIRLGNFFIVMPPGRSHQVRAEKFISNSLAQDTPVALWMYNFPNVNMNHCVVVCARRSEGSRTLFAVYDPNYDDGPRTLTFDAATREFMMEKTFYFPGGLVHVRPAFVNALE